MNQNKIQSLTTSNLLHILHYLPHSHIISHLTLVNKFFNNTIQDFPIFHNYTLKFDCGRRGSVLGKASKGFVDNRGNLKTSKNPEVIIHDKQKIILISTTNKPLRSQHTKDALTHICNTAINKIYFRSYRIPQPIMSGLSAPSSANSSPFQLDSLSTLQLHNNKLPSIQENNRARYTNGSMVPLMLEAHQSSNVLQAPSPYDNNRQSYSSSMNSDRLSSTMSTINSDVVDLSFPSSHSVRMSGLSSTSGSTMNDELRMDCAFETLIDLLKPAPFESLTIGEECVSWTFQNVITCLQNFTKIQHLAVHVGFERSSMPYIKSRQKWLDFIGLHHTHVTQLDSIYCNDDAFLRCMTSLSLYRDLGKQLTFIEDAKEPSYEKGSLKAINTKIDDIYEPENSLNGHFIQKQSQTQPHNMYSSNKELSTHALSYIRYRCWDAPECDLTGIEFDGAKVLEVSPYDCMFITVPQSVISFRVSCGGQFYDEPDEYKIVFSLTNRLKELCVYNIHNLDRMEGLFHLKWLEYVVIKRKPKDKDVFMKHVEKLCKHSPVKQITLMFNGKYKRNNQRNDYWRDLRTISVRDHNLIVVKDQYCVPMDIPELGTHSKYSDYKYK